MVAIVSLINFLESVFRIRKCMHLCFNFLQLCAWIASNYWIYFDPIGAIIVSVYIATTWFMTGKEHLAMLSGKSAKPDFINRIVRVNLSSSSPLCSNSLLFSGDQLQTSQSQFSMVFLFNAVGLL